MSRTVSGLRRGAARVCLSTATSRTVGFVCGVSSNRTGRALLSNGVDLRTVAGRLGHSEGSTTLNFYAQFVQPADDVAATMVSGQLAELRKQERQRELTYVGG
jgi:hypothetical protein